MAKKSNELDVDMVGSQENPLTKSEERRICDFIRKQKRKTAKEFSSPEEYERHLAEKVKIESTSFRNALLEGYSDAVKGKTRKFYGDLMDDLKAYKAEKS